MVSDNAAIRPALTRDEVGTVLGKTMGLVAVTVGAFAVGAYLMTQSRRTSSPHRKRRR